MDPTAYLYNENTVQPWKRSSVPCTEVQLEKSLTKLGIKGWADLEPGNMINIDLK